MNREVSALFAMESTDVYWIPLLDMLQGRGFEVVLTDTRTLSRVPGRKTDVLDVEQKVLDLLGTIPVTDRIFQRRCVTIHGLT